ncbi:MAG TPA: hypothetical protein VIL46_12565 [Gemmataceae bacterium]
MTRLPRAAAALCACLLLGPATRAAAPPPGPAAGDGERIKALVRQLGAPRFRERDLAARELVRMGRAARPALQEGLADPDPEVRERCRQLLPRVAQADLDARIAAFAAAGAGGHGLPGWERFREMTGGGPAARALFAEVMRADGLALEEAESDAALLARRYQQRAAELQHLLAAAPGRAPGAAPAPPRTEIAALLLLGSDPRLGGEAAEHTPAANLFYQPLFRAALTADDPSTPVLRKLLLAWLERRRDTGSVYHSLYLIVQCDMKEALPVAVKLARDASLPGHARAMAVLAVGKFGGERQIADLEPLLSAEIELGTFRFNDVQGTTQLRDVALAMCARLAGQNPADYGFDLLPHQPLNFSYFYNLGFSDPGKREAAHKKWKAWRESQRR